NRLLLSLQRGGEPRDKIHSVIERVGQVLDLDRCVIVLFAEGDHEDYYGEWCAVGVRPVTDLADVRDRSPVRHALKTERRPLFASDISTHPLASGLHDLIEAAQLKSMMVVPIMHLGRVIGSLSAHQTRRRREWGEDDIDLLVAVATHVGATLENARLITELRESNRLKDEFLATLSHELRTPLTAILGWAGLLRSVKLDAETAAGALETIERNARSQKQLIDDLLDASRIITGKLRLEARPTRLAPVVEAAVESVRPAAISKGIDLGVEIEGGALVVAGDAERLQQIVWNLLSNAVKFTPQGGRVGVALAREGEDALVTVSDTGVGIAPDFLPHVFDRFRQADASTTRTFGGLGLGLSIVRHLVELHGGRVSAESEGGATFRVRLPLIPPDAGREVTEDSAGASAAARGEGQQRLSGLRLLVVDDDPDTLLMLCKTLERYGAGVEACESVAAALSALDDSPAFDVLVSDIGMPVEDGNTLMRRIVERARERGTTPLPALALTAYARVEDRDAALDAGFGAHIAKPVAPAELVEAVAKLASRAREV
ncbi:MAG: ATP-binding protein, partial [Pyrinomonadaceae bacterium]